MKRKTANYSKKQVISKRSGKNQAFYAYTHTSLFSMVFNFLVELFAIFLKVLHLV